MNTMWCILPLLVTTFTLVSSNPFPGIDEASSVGAKDLELLGSIQKTRKVLKNGNIVEVQQAWRYWKSVNTAPWATAGADCRNNGDTLVYLETKEEVDNITRWLRESDSTATTYWTGGTIDGSDFIWDNDVPISPEFPWASGEPRLTGPNTRVMLSWTGRRAEFKTQANTNELRYICEGPWPGDDSDGSDVPVPCYKNNELIILVDSSGSISAAEYTTAREFTARLASAWVDYSGSRTSVQIFSTTAEAIFGLTDSQAVPTIKEKVYGMRHMAGNTRTDLGISLAITEILRNARNVMKNLVVLTDGESFDQTATKAAADRAIALGIRTFAVGIGNGVKRDELLAIAGGNNARVFIANEFNDLLEILRALSGKICE